ncbi:MAG: hypothetical protein AB1489_29985 [Acidobacteriota bacterium]
MTKEPNSSLDSELQIHKDGTPLTTLYQQLRSAYGIYSTRSERILTDRSKLDRINPTTKFIDKLGFDKPTVHIIDREADSVGHYLHL